MPTPCRAAVFYKLADGTLTCGDNLRFPWRPFLGTLGTAPALEAVSALTPHAHGGNMDVRDTAPGRTVYLPVFVPGALFFTVTRTQARGTESCVGSRSKSPLGRRLHST